MKTELLSLILDFAVLLALGGTIYYVMRLSTVLNNFKKHRTELKKIILELTKNIDHAQSSITGLKAASDTAADNLDDALHDARRMADELKMINETSDSLASRLEETARKSRLAVPQNHDFIDELDEEFSTAEEDDRAVVEPPSFFIQDTEFETPHEGDDGLGVAGANDFSSQAEKELYDALQQNKKKAGGRRQ